MTIVIKLQCFRCGSIGSSFFTLIRTRFNLLGVVISTLGGKVSMGKGKQFFKRFKVKIMSQINSYRVHGRTKIFCIGRNKTGTTSLKKAFEELGYLVGKQEDAEVLYDRYYFKGEFLQIIKYCESSQVFQDVPFSCPETYKYLDKAYPGSKFILTVRNDADQWYQSLTRFHAKMFGSNGQVPDVEDLKKAIHNRKGFMYNTVKLHGTSDTDPYNKEIMMSHYDKYNKDVKEYFKARRDDLLIINVAEDDAYTEFLQFLGITSSGGAFPWENKT